MGIATLLHVTGCVGVAMPGFAKPWSLTQARSTRGDCSIVLTRCAESVLRDIACLAAHIACCGVQDGNGSVDFRETVLGLSFSGNHGTEEKLRMAFAVYDTNNDGVISQDELRKVRSVRRRLSAVPLVTLC